MSIVRLLLKSRHKDFLLLAPSLLDLLQLLDLLYKIGFLIIELLVLGAVCMELGKKVNQLVLVPQQDVQDWLGLVGVCDENLENMEGLKLNVPRLLLQHVHHQLQVFGAGNVLCHHRKVVSIKEQLAQQFERLPPCYVVITVKQLFVLLENLKKKIVIFLTGTEFDFKTISITLLEEKYLLVVIELR